MLISMTSHVQPADRLSVSVSIVNINRHNNGNGKVD